MKCKNCNAELAEGTLVCANCGTDNTDALSNTEAAENAAEQPVEAAPAAEAEAPAEPKAEEPAETEAPKAEEPAAENTALAEKAPKKNMPLIVGGAVVAVAVVGFAASQLMGGGGGKNTELPSELAYVKDGAIYSVDLKDPDAEGTEYTDSFVDSDNALSVTGFGFTTLSPDGKYRIYPEKYDSDGSFNLFLQSGDEKPEKISGSVTGYHITSDNHILYLKDGGLYVTSPGEKEEKLDSDVTAFYVSADEKTVMWYVLTDDESSYRDYYCRDLALEGKEVKLCAAGTLLSGTANFEKLLFQKENGVYLSSNLAAGEKLVDDAASVYSVDLNRNTFFYTVNEEKSVKAADYVIDDMAATDAQITEPVKEDYEYERQNYWYTYTAVSDEYYEKLNEYRAKEFRDEFRKDLEDSEITISYTELYYYADGEETLITSDFYSSSAVTDPLFDTAENEAVGSALIYQKRLNSGNVSKVNISEIETVAEVETHVKDTSDAEYDYFLCAGGVDQELDLDDQLLMKTRFDAVNNQFYLFLMEEDAEEEVGDLWTLSLSEEGMPLTEYTDDVSSLDLVSGGNVYYMKDINKGYGDLYRNTDSVMYDVAVNGVFEIPDSSAVLCVTDYDAEKATGTLNLLSPDAEEEVEIGYDIYLGNPSGNTLYGPYTTFLPIKVLSADSMYMFQDYSISRGNGDLMYFDGTELRRIDSDVSAYLYNDLRGDLMQILKNVNTSNGFYRDYTMTYLRSYFSNWVSGAASETESAYN